MNKKGFTLVELLATLIVLALVMSLGTYSISSIIENSKEKNYELLISNIKDAAESYYNECRYMPTMECSEVNGGYQISLSELVVSGFLKGNSVDDSNNKVVDPRDNNDMSNCIINISKSSGRVNVTYGSNCPK